MSKYDTTLFQYFQNLKNQLKVSPLNLGGTAVSSGGPPGGFTGYLPQNRVGYDPYEAAISGFSSATPYNSSGILVDANLIDNLNHIRYRITSLEELAFTGNYVSVKENEILVASGVTVLNFEGSVNVEETAPAEVTITITSSGTGVDTDEKAKVSSNDTTANYLENKIVAGDNISITVLNDGSNETLEINSTASGSAVGSFTDLSDTPNSYIGQAGKYPRVNLTEDALEFATASGTGNPITIRDEGTALTTEVTSIDFVGPNVIATASGTAVTVTISGSSSSVEVPFVGAKTYRTTNQQLTTSVSWQNITWEASEYESDSNMWSSGGEITILEAGYYSVIGHVTISGDLPTTERIQLGIFDVNTFLVGIYDGYYTSTSGNRTLQVLYQGPLVVGDGINLKLFNGAGVQPYVLSGVQNTFLAVHKIHGAIQNVDLETQDPKIVNTYLTGYISANNETETVITWNAENYDTDTMWSSGSQIQINTAGYYHVDASCVWEDLNNHGNVPFQVKIGVRLNGTTMIAQKWEWHDVDTDGDRTEGLSTPISCDTPYLDTDDYLEIVVWHSKGSTASNIIRPPAYNTYCMVHKIQ